MNNLYWVMKHLHMMIGGTGTRKSTLSKTMNIELGYTIFSPDDIENENYHLEGSAIDELYMKNFSN